MDRLDRSKPPKIPPGLTYTQNYCEENIYRLAQRFLQTDYDLPKFWQSSVVFMSNENQSIAIWNQDVSDPDKPEKPLVWDYHVILVMRPLVSSGSHTAWVYDYSSSLPMPSPWHEYMPETFKSNYYHIVPEEFRSLFRIIPALDYVEQFASDRSHMIKSRKPREDGEDGEEGEVIEYRSSPPDHKPIIGYTAAPQGITNNLTESFINMGPSTGVGMVLSADAFWRWGAMN